jgi:hypothetical protein
MNFGKTFKHSPTYEYGSHGHERNGNDNDNNADPLVDLGYLGLLVLKSSH